MSLATLKTQLKFSIRIISWNNSNYQEQALKLIQFVSNHFQKINLLSSQAQKDQSIFSSHSKKSLNHLDSYGQVNW